MSNKVRPEIALSVYLNEQLLGILPVGLKNRRPTARGRCHVPSLSVVPWQLPVVQRMPSR